MKVYGKPEFLNLYNKYYAPLLRGIGTDLAFPDLESYFLSPSEMPAGHPTFLMPHFQPPNIIRIPVPVMHDIGIDLYFKSQTNVFFHEIGHYAEQNYLPNKSYTDIGWQEWSRLTGKQLDFGTYSKLSGHSWVQTQEDFAWDFSYWVQGQRLHMEHFYMSLWGQAVDKSFAEYVDVFRVIDKFAKTEGKRKLREVLSAENPRALVYL